MYPFVFLSLEFTKRDCSHCSSPSFELFIRVRLINTELRNDTLHIYSLYLCEESCNFTQKVNNSVVRVSDQSGETEKDSGWTLQYCIQGR